MPSQCPTFYADFMMTMFVQIPPYLLNVMLKKALKKFPKVDQRMRLL